MSKSIIILLLVTSGFLAQQKYRQFRLQKKIDEEKQNLQNQLQELEGKNQQLTETLGYLNSDTYREVIARQQLNMQKQGEIVYGFSDSANTQETQGLNGRKATNFQKWTKYFLNKK